MKIEAPSVLQFTDFRAYLNAYVDFAKNRNHRWSLGAWAQRVDLKGASCISRILNGRRMPSLATTRKLIDYFGFEGEEAEHFQELVRKARVKNDPILSGMLEQKIARSADSPELVVPEEPSQESQARESQEIMKLIGEWKHFAILEMIELPDFRGDPEWISRRLRFQVSAEECRGALARLVDLGFVTWDEYGTLKRAVTSVFTRNDVPSQAGRQYHRQMLQNASVAIEQVPIEEREFQAWGCAVPKALIPEIKKLCREFRKEVKTLIHEASNGQPLDEVYQFQVQFFPLTRKEDSQ